LIDDSEDPKLPSVDQGIVDKIDAPALVGAVRRRRHAPMQADVLAAPHPQAQLQAVQPI
jgi:hypothetical protein